MNFFEAQEFFKKMYPGKKISYDFDDNCARMHEIIYTEGKPNTHHHVDNDQVRVSVEGMDPFYCPIQSHRLTVHWNDLSQIIQNKINTFGKMPV